MDNIKQEPEDIKEDIIEGYDLVISNKKYSDLVPVFDILNQKYYKCPLKGINENIRLFDKERKEIKFEFRLVTIKPFDIIINTYFNENNRGQIRNKLNTLFAVVCPKYEYFINYSVSPDIYITCDNKIEVDSLEATEVSIRHVVGTKKGKILKTNIVSYE